MKRNPSQVDEPSTKDKPRNPVPVRLICAQKHLLQSQNAQCISLLGLETCQKRSQNGQTNTKLDELRYVFTIEY